MIRIFIIAFLFWLIIWVIRGYRSGTDKSQAQELVCDALTGVYFPQKEALSINRGGEIIYFMNVENRDKYLAINR